MNYLTAKQIAAKFSMSPKTVWKQGSIFASLTRIQIGRNVRFLESEVNQLAASLEPKPSKVHERHLHVVGRMR